MRASIALLCLMMCGEVAAQRTWDTLPTMPDWYRRRVELFASEPKTTGGIIFLGNSITQGGNWRKMLKDSAVVNRGIGGDITFGVMNRLDEVIARRPDKLFLLIGVNDLSKKIPEEVVVENIFSIVARIRKGSPKTAIFVQSILPVNPAFEKFPKNYDRQEKVVLVNEQLKKFSAQLNFTFVDLFSHFLDKEGRLDARFSTDGLHLNNKGYDHWVGILKSLKYL